MKVLFVIPLKTGFTGAALAPIRLMFGLLEKGIEVHVVATEPPQDQMYYLEKLKEKNAKITIIPSTHSGRKFWHELAKKGLEVLDENDIQIFHAHVPKLVYFMGKQVKKRDKKIVMMLSGNPMYEVRNLGITTKLFHRMVWRSCKKYVDIFCPVSNWLSGEIKKQDKIDNLHPIHVTIDIEKYLNAKENPRDDLGIEKSKFVFTTVARLDPVKNLDVLIKAFAKFAHDKNSMLAIFGQGELKSQLEKLVKELKIKDKVEFFGFQKDIADVIKISDVFVLPSSYEPFGAVGAEAGICKIPVIVSDAGGMKEYIIDSETGLQFKVGDVDDLERCLVKLYENPELRKKLGENLSKRVIENYSPNNIAEKVIDVYKGVLN